MSGIRFQQKKNTAANWTSANPVLLSGELGFETDTNKVKIGDGTTAWNSLAYLLAGTYLGLTAKATDSDLLDGHDTAYFQIAGSYLVAADITGKEDSANKENTTIDTSATKYPTVNLLKTGLDLKASLTGTETLTNKRITSRITTITSHATPTINTDDCDVVTITALATSITSMTTNLSGTPTNFQKLRIRIKDDGTARGITWGASFLAGGIPLPTTTVISKVLSVFLEWDSVATVWKCKGAMQE